MKREKPHSSVPISYSGGVSMRGSQVESPSAANGNQMILRDVRIVEEGEAKSYDVWMDKAFVEKTVALAQNRRIKCRMGHPGMCSEAMGSYLGYFDNFRVAEDEKGSYAIADLNLSEVANKSPQGRLADYIMEMSQKAPDMFGASIVFYEGKRFYKTDKGVNIYNGNLTAEGEQYDAAKHGAIDDSKRYHEIAQLEETDLVDSPAATTSLFSEQSSLFSQIISFFGGGFSAKKAALSLRQAIIQEIDNMAKRNINATTTDGTPIVVVTENAFIGIGDSVQDDAGTALPDGDYPIADSDSGQTGQTITVMAGVITHISTTVAASTEPAPVGEAAMSAALKKLSNDVSKLSAQLTALQEAGKLTTEAVAQLSDRLGIVENLPEGKKTQLPAKDKKGAEGNIPDYQREANELSARFNKK